MQGILDLPGLIQSLATQRRTGELVVSCAAEVRRLRVVQGTLCGLSGSTVERVARALLWARVIRRDHLAPVLDNLPQAATPDLLVRALMDMGLVSIDGILDAIDCLVEEEMVVVLGWAQPQVAFDEHISEDAWLTLQAEYGVAIAPGSLLLECLRRQDELATVAAELPDPWDAVLTDNAQVAVESLSDDAQVFMASFRDGMFAGTLLDHPTVPPFRAAMAMVELLQCHRCRLADPTELVALAEHEAQEGRRKVALGLYRRAIERGQTTPRMYLHVADLAEALGDRPAAAAACVAAAAQTPDPAVATTLLHRALDLGADDERPLRQLVDLHFVLGERPEAADALQRLASWYERFDQPEAAIRCLRESQELDADAAVTGQHLARLYLAQGDVDQACLQLELAARAYHESDRLDEAIACWRSLLERHPGRCDFARECAELLLWSGCPEDALTLLRGTLARRDDASEDLLVAVYELLARLDPADVQAHDWLAKAYERRRDRRGATEQLRLSAAALEKAGDDVALAATLERILELDPHQVDEIAWLAQVRLRLRQDVLAATLFLRACDEAVAQGQRREARSILETAAHRLPWHHAIQGRLGLAALRDGDRPAALRHLLAGAHLAEGSAEVVACCDLLIQASRLKPEDLLLKVRLADLAERAAIPDVERIQSEVVRAAVRSSNFGIAIDMARRRIQRQPTVEHRSELVELLRRAGDHAAELAVGQELLAEVLQEGHFELAVEILSRLVASHPKDADLALQLAEAHNSLGDQRTALRLYRHALPLLQADDRVQDAKDVLEIIAEQSDEPDVVAVVRERLHQGQAVDWERVRLELAQRRRLLERVASDTHVRTSTERRRPPVPQRTPLPDDA